MSATRLRNRRAAFPRHATSIRQLRGLAPADMTIDVQETQLDNMRTLLGSQTLHQICSRDFAMKTQGAGPQARPYQRISDDPCPVPCSCAYDDAHVSPTKWWAEHLTKSLLPSRGNHTKGAR